MSWKATGWAATVHFKPPNDGLKLLLVIVADRADDCGHTWPSHKWLGDVMERDERTVRRRLHSLEGLGLLKTAPRHDATGRQKANAYQVLFPERRFLDDCERCVFEMNQSAAMGPSGEVDNGVHLPLADTMLSPSGETDICPPHTSDLHNNDQNPLISPAGNGQERSASTAMPGWARKLADRLFVFANQPLTITEVGELLEDHPDVDWDHEVVLFADYWRQKSGPKQRGRMRALHRWAAKAREYRSGTNGRLTNDASGPLPHDPINPNCPCPSCETSRHYEDTFDEDGVFKGSRSRMENSHAD